MEIPKKGEVPKVSWERGLVDVQFKEKTRAKYRTTGRPTERVQLREAKDTRSMRSILRKLEVKNVLRSVIASSQQEQRRFYRRIRKQKPSVEDLSLFYTLVFPKKVDVKEVARELADLPFVARASPRPTARPASHIPDCHLPTSHFTAEPLVGRRDILHTVDLPNDLENQWYLYRIRADLAWRHSDARGVTVADIDWGYRLTHQDLAPSFDLAHAYNSFDGSANVSVGGSIYHGTGVTGIAGAAHNRLGMLGVAPRCRLWPIQGNTGTGTSIGGNSWANGIDYVRAQRGQVAILEVQTGSFGNYEMDMVTNAAILNAVNAGVVVCVAAGNGDRDAGIDDLGQPIPFTGSIVVGATEYEEDSDPRAWFSNHGPRVDVAAPGDSFHDLTASSNADDEYRNGFGGTSGATPKVAGAVALMLASNPSLSPGQVRAIIRQSAQPNVTDEPVGGFLDAEVAVRMALRWGRSNRWERCCRCRN